MGGGEITPSSRGRSPWYPWYGCRILIAVQGTPGTNGWASRRGWKEEGSIGGAGGVVVISVWVAGCRSAPAPELQCCLSETVAGGGEGAEAGGADVTWDWGCGSIPAPGLQCCNSETVAGGGGEEDGGVAISTNDADRNSSSGSHSWTLSMLRMASASSMSWGLDAPPSWVMIVGGRGVSSSGLGWSSAGGVRVYVCRSQARVSVVAQRALKHVEFKAAVRRTHMPDERVVGCVCQLTLRTHEAGLARVGDDDVGRLLASGRGCCSDGRGVARLGRFRSGGVPVGWGFARRLLVRSGGRKFGEGSAPRRGRSFHLVSPHWMRLSIHTSSSP